LEKLDKVEPTIPEDSAHLLDDSAHLLVERRRGSGVWLGWVASIVIWALVVWAAYAYRAEVMAAWPPSQRLYAALGLGPGS